MSRPIIAIDGPSGAGKSTVARALARRLRLPHVDTGALYRAVTLAVLRSGVDPRDAEGCAKVARSVDVRPRDDRTLLDGEDVEDDIRGEPVTAAVSTVSAHPQVREVLLPVQRAAAAGGGVVEGRDIGTVVFPDADLKVFLTAETAERVRRRAAERGTTEQVAVQRELVRRDAKDRARTVAPLIRAEDAWEFDTTGMTVGEVVDAIVALAEVVWRQQGRDPHQLTGARKPSAEAAPVGVADRSEQEPPATPEREPPGAREGPIALGKANGGSGSTALRKRAALPRVAVVGRANVGKSTLVNRIIGRRTAIVEERPGVTRDRTEHLTSWRGRPFLIVDTGGWEHRPDGMAARVVAQAEAAIDQADLVIFVVDATVGVQEDDERYARLLRRADVPVILAANKTDSDRQLPGVYELYPLGLGEPHPISAAHGHGVGDLLDLVAEQLSADAPSELPDESGVPRVAIVGRPNVGKSALYNRLLGEERTIVDPVPHTTRDAVDTLVAVDGEPWVFVDTAGLRRRYRQGEETELYSADRTRSAVETADLALFVVDGSQPIGEQDQRLAAMVRDRGCGIVLVVNKWDLVDADRHAVLERELDRLLAFAHWAPRVNVSALTGRGVDRIVPRLREVWEAYRARIPTSELNRWLEVVTARVAPPAARGVRQVRLRYITQVKSAPPTFVLFASGQIQPSYLRYLERELRRQYGFTGTPVAFETRSASRRRS